MHRGSFGRCMTSSFANQEHLKRADLEPTRATSASISRFKQDLDHQTWKNTVAPTPRWPARWVVGTPNFFINGRPLRGALPIDTSRGHRRRAGSQQETSCSRHAAGRALREVDGRCANGTAAAGIAAAGSRRSLPSSDLTRRNRAEIEGAPFKVQDALVTIVEFRLPVSLLRPGGTDHHEAVHRPAHSEWHPISETSRTALAAGKRTCDSAPLCEAAHRRGAFCVLCEFLRFVPCYLAD